MKQPHAAFALAFGLFCISLAVVSEAFEIPVQFLSSVIIAAFNPLKLRVQIFRNWVIIFETLYIGLTTRNAGRIGTPQFLPAALQPPSAFHRVRIDHAVASGET